MDLRVVRGYAVPKLISLIRSIIVSDEVAELNNSVIHVTQFQS